MVTAMMPCLSRDALAPPSPLPRQPGPAPPQVFPSALIVRHDPSDGLPVLAAVSAVPQMHEFVDDDAVHQSHGSPDDAPIGRHVSGPVTGGAVHDFGRLMSWVDVSNIDSNDRIIDEGLYRPRSQA